MPQPKESALQAARGLIEFINKSPSPFHVVEQCRLRLIGAGFKELCDRDKWQLEKNGNYFTTCNKSTIVAFSIGGDFQAGNGFSMIGAHTDSPCLKVKPNSKKTKSGYLSVGVECYGGGIWGTWFDRDLTVAGRVIVRDGNNLKHHLVNISKPILRIPHLAIHLQRNINENFSPNKETHLVPILATAAQVELNGHPRDDSSESKSKSQSEKHHPLLVQMLCEKIGCTAADVLDFELCLADTQPAVVRCERHISTLVDHVKNVGENVYASNPLDAAATTTRAHRTKKLHYVLGGALDEFLFSPRLDNLHNAYCAIEGLVESLQDSSLASETNTRMVVLYDNEEVGSQSAQGAGSTLTEHIMRRVASAFGPETEYARSICNSFLLSADQAHAVHPNYADKHEDNHKPRLHGGPVLKFNCNQRYATTAPTASIVRVIAEECGVPLQEVVVRNDSACGSTIGPILSAKLGVRTLDIGGPQLAMHSIREMCCTTSVQQSTLLYTNFLRRLSTVDKSLVMG